MPYVSLKAFLNCGLGSGGATSLSTLSIGQKTQQSIRIIRMRRMRMNHDCIFVLMIIACFGIDEILHEEILCELLGRLVAEKLLI